MTDGTIAILAGVAMAGAFVAQVADYILTLKGLDRGMVEVGVINRLFIKSKADASKLPVITFVEAGVTLGLFSAAFVIGGPAAGLAFAVSLLAGEVANDVHSLKLVSGK